MGAHVSACTSWLGRGAAMAASPLDHNSTTTPYFYDVPGFFCQLTSCGAPYSYPFSLPFHCQQMIRPGSMLQTSISSTQPPFTTGDTVVQAGVLRALAQTMCPIFTLLCLLQTIHSILLWSPKVFFLFQLISPLWGRENICVPEHFLTFNFLLVLLVSVVIPLFSSFFLFLFFFLFLYFILSSCKGIFLF